MGRKTNIEKILNRFRSKVGEKNTLRLKVIGSAMRRPIYKFQVQRKIIQLSKKNIVVSQYQSQDFSLWRKGFRRMMMQSNEQRFVDMIEEFYKNSLEIIRMHIFGEEGPIVVCALKNERIRVQEFYKHYRSLGVKGFIMIDNGSDDGTREFIAEQEDTLALFTSERYNSKCKTAWINKAISYIGLNRWYLIVDSDEFFVYPEMENLSISEYVKKLEKKKIYSVKTLMLEMYPNTSFFDSGRKPEDFRRDYCYFDVDGQFHGRLFESENGGQRIKISLIFYNGERFATGSHDFYPFDEYWECRWGGIVLHYKFLPNERQRIKEIAEAGTYANNSRLYKKYLQTFDKDVNLCPYYEGSRKWEGAESFQYFGYIERLSE